MASTVRGQYKVTSQDATTVTLQPVTGDTAVGDLADKISQIVITFAAARDTAYFDVTNRVFEIGIQKK